MNAAGGYITPGFLDIHRHGDWQAFGNGDDELLNRQGLTTVVNGNCGLSVAPAGEKFGKEIARFLSSVTGDFRWGKDENMIYNYRLLGRRPIKDKIRHWLK